MIRIAEFFEPHHSSLIQLVKQCGVKEVVGSMDWSRGLDVPPDQLPWSFDSLQQQQNRYRDKGFELVVLENRPPMEKIKLGLPGRDDEIEQGV